VVQVAIEEILLGKLLLRQSTKQNVKCLHLGGWIRSGGITVFLVIPQIKALESLRHTGGGNAAKSRHLGIQIGVEHLLHVEMSGPVGLGGMLGLVFLHEILGFVLLFQKYLAYKREIGLHVQVAGLKL